MESIKEKAEEYSSGYINLDRQLVAKQALEYGANYVLKQIEEIIRYDKDPHVIEALKERIWRLKQ